MKKDIHIPEVNGVEIAIVKQYNEDFLQDAWYAYVFNNTNEPIEAVLIVSQAKGMIDNEQRQSSLFRHAFPKVEPHGAQKVELLDEGVFILNNTFMLTYFQEGTLFDKIFTFEANTITDKNLIKVDYFDDKVILTN